MLALSVVGLTAIADSPASAKVASWPSGSWVNPSSFTSYEDWGFGICGDPPYVAGKAHLGVDSQGGGLATRNTPVRAIASGVVRKVGTNWPGSALGIEHVAGNGTHFLAAYGHINTTLTVGATVVAGQQLGTILDQQGNSHLHFGVRPMAAGESVASVALRGSRSCTEGNFGYVNPLPWLAANPATGGLTVPAGLVARPHQSRVQLTWSPVAGATGYLVTRDGFQFTVATNSWVDQSVSPNQSYVYSVQALSGAATSGKAQVYVQTFRESADRAYLRTSAGPAMCGRVGDQASQRLICHVLKSTGWASFGTGAGDWGYAPDRAWVQNTNGTVSYCGRVGAGNQVRCDTFNGTAWTSRTSGVVDPTYPDPL